MTYWVYEDDRTNWVRVHEAKCRYCNDGKGIKGSRLPDNRWHGPFENDQEAITKAVSTGRRDVKGCGWCLQSLLPMNYYLNGVSNIHIGKRTQ